MKTKPIEAPKDWQHLQPHPLSELVEFGAGIDLDAMAEHMRQHGYDPDEAIILHEGKILDGRHRLPAAITAGVTPTFKLFTGLNAMAYVAKKLFRQHLDTSQRAMMAATLTKVSPLAGVQNCTPPTLAEAAETLNVSRRSVANAAKVQEEGTPALNQAVKDGTITVGDAASVATQPPEVQNAAVEAVRSGQAGTASQAAGLNPTLLTPAHSVFCETCQRRGPRRNCEECQQLRRTKRGQRVFEREPGDDAGNTRAKAEQNGIPEHDWRPFISATGVLINQLDAIGKPHGVRNGPEAKRLRTKFREWVEEVCDWYEALTGLKRPKEFWRRDGS
jgi:hypothetical protein